MKIFLLSFQAPYYTQHMPIFDMMYILHNFQRALNVHYGNIHMKQKVSTSSKEGLACIIFSRDMSNLHSFFIFHILDAWLLLVLTTIQYHISLPCGLHCNCLSSSMGCCHLQPDVTHGLGQRILMTLINSSNKKGYN